MRYYLAPLEGITTNIYRKVYHKHFAPMDKYFTPFLVPHEKKGFSTKEKREILPEFNEGQYLVPQVMSNNAADCLSTLDKLKAIGYDEANLNFGCPSKTVVSKKRGSGFLAYPDELEAFLDEVIGKTDMKISIKTRIGKLDSDEFYRILEIYNQYKLEELIIHPRLQSDYYKNHPNMEMFAYAMRESKNPLCYNGDLFTVDDIKTFENQNPNINTIMLGRGVMRNPGIVEQMKTGTSLNKDKLRAFHDDLLQEYIEYNSGIIPVLFKMKEIWAYMGNTFSGGEKYLKKLRKTDKLEVYEEMVNELFALLS